ncbi:hypothetical protein ZIOFF_038663 [Zingiber officinale]|uniref:DDE Tnp4 domain-containing protein n=1 Tax=Zingiber officinale TaxID=94328 RepID=A0A8J5L2F8_ZINOF|nr:hypothetical protein ZIOFF_038663 [Zingiber officinale]
MGGHNPGIEVEKYEWSKANVVMFVEIIYDKAKQNKLQTSTFSNTVWEEINKGLYLSTKTNYGVHRLKDTSKVNAPEEVWSEFYMKNKREYKAIRKEGYDHFHILSEVFGGTTAIGDMHRAFIQLPPTSDEERELEEDSLIEIMSSSDDESDDELGLDINLILVLGIANDFFHDMMTKYLGYIDRVSCQTSSLTGRMYIQEILDGHPQVCLTISNCLGAIDGNHVSTWAPTSIQTSFRDRKVIVTQNVMFACDFDMLFTFVFTGWEGRSNDSRVFIDTLIRHENNFPKPCSDQFYLVDFGYLNMPGVLA